MRDFNDSEAVFTIFFVFKFNRFFLLGGESRVVEADTIVWFVFVKVFNVADAGRDVFKPFVDALLGDAIEERHPTTPDCQSVVDPHNEVSRDEVAELVGESVSVRNVILHTTLEFQRTKNCLGIKQVPGKL